MTYTLEQLAMIGFISVSSIGTATLKKLQDFARDNQSTLHQLWHSEKELKRAPLKPLQRDAVTAFKKIYSLESYHQYLRSGETEILFETSTNYPSLLRELEEKPAVLFTKGNQAVELTLPVAVVGTRRLTSTGKRATQEIVSELIEHGCQIVSGCMYGADAEAHRTCFRHDAPTVGVLGFGFEHCYPASFKGFFEEFIERGNLLISEYPPFTMAQAGNFPQRNRLIAGMSLITVVTEAGLKSGTHITANWAAEFGRNVCVLPTAKDNPYCDGMIKLVHNGAYLVRSATEIISIAGVG